MYLQIVNKKIYILFFYGFYLTYFLLLGFFLLGRRTCFRGIELNPVAFLSYLGGRREGLKTLFNIVLFIPLGILLISFRLRGLYPFPLQELT